MPLEQRIWDNVDKTEACWLWTGTLNWKGYGRVWASGRTQGVHRVVYQLAHPAADIRGLQIDHVCHNTDKDCAGGVACVHRRCVRPDHLEAVDGWTNTQRGRNPIGTRAATGLCARGHERTEENTYRWRGTTRCRPCLRDYQRSYGKGARR